MQYVKASGNTVNKFPYSIGLLRKENPNTSFPKRMSNEQLASWDVYPVTEAPDPVYDARTEYIVINTEPTLIDGSWVRNKTVATMSAEQLEEKTAILEGDGRAKRNRLIAETDWWASSDLTMTAEQTAYRQALRDITTHANWPHLSEDDWPTKP